MFNWNSDKTIVQKCQYLKNLGYLFTASKISNNCISCGGFIKVGSKYYSSTKEPRGASHQAHECCVLKILAPYKQNVKVLTEMTVPMKDCLFIEDLIEDTEDQLKYQDESWEPIVEDTNAFTVHQAAEYLGVSTRTIYNYVKTGKVRRVGDNFIIEESNPLIAKADKSSKFDSVNPPIISTEEEYWTKTPTLNPTAIFESNEDSDKLKEARNCFRDPGFGGTLVANRESKVNLDGWQKPSMQVTFESEDSNRLTYLEGKVDALKETIETLYKLLLERK